jgi:HAD superfamily hydrolase (TIGR01450 family)
MTLCVYDRVRTARAIFLDWDGCVVQDGALLDGARAFLDAFGDRVSILSNNSTDEPHRISGFLAGAGVQLPAERIHLAGVAALELVARRFVGRTVMLLGNAPMRRAAARLGLHLTAGDHHDVVVLLRDTDFTFQRLAAAVDRLNRGAHFVIANLDLTHPKSGGVVPETGALLAAISTCVDLEHVQTTVVGKPSAILFERALATIGALPGEVLMIGDNPSTDAEGARRLGIEAVLIGGKTGRSLGTLMEPTA